MADPLLPGQHGQLADKEGRATRDFYGWFQWIQKKLATVTTTVTETAAAVAAIPPQTTVTGSTTVDVFGSPDSGYTVALHPGVIQAGGMGPPGRDGEDGESGFPVPGHRGADGATGAQGPMGVAVFMAQDPIEPEVWMIPGAQGPQGNTGAAGAGAGVGAQVNYAKTISTTTASTTSTTIPTDTSIPQNTEGVAYASLDTAITPTASTSLLEIEVVIPYASGSATPTSIVIALFRDSGANALAAAYQTVSGAQYGLPLILKTVVSASSTSATTFKLRWAVLSGTGYLLNYAGTQYYGTANQAVMIVREIAQ